MPSDQHKSIMAKATSLIFSLFDIASAQEVPFGIPQYMQYMQYIFQGLNSVLLCVPLIFADYRGAFQTVLNLYCCVTS